MAKCKNCGFESKSTLFSYRWCPYCGEIITDRHITLIEKGKEKREPKSFTDKLKVFFNV